MKFLFIISIFLSLGAGRVPVDGCPTHYHSSQTDVCKHYLTKVASQCVHVETQLAMDSFYDRCLICNKYKLASNPALERIAFGCWIRVNDNTLTQQEAEALVPSFDFSTIYQENFSY